MSCKEMGLCEKRGCLPTHDGSVVLRMGSLEFTECPILSAQRTGLESVAMVSSALQGQMLPYSGGLLDQPGLCMDATSIYLAQTERDKKSREKK